jgi:hypothetical protein
MTQCGIYEIFEYVEQKIQNHGVLAPIVNDQEKRTRETINIFIKIYSGSRFLTTNMLNAGWGKTFVVEYASFSSIFLVNLLTKDAMCIIVPYNDFEEPYFQAFHMDASFLTSQEHCSQTWLLYQEVVTQFQKRKFPERKKVRSFTYNLVNSVILGHLLN